LLVLWELTIKITTKVITFKINDTLSFLKWSFICTNLMMAKNQTFLS
jgi:hypothetical protein